jgi:hypothetical protein
LLKASVADKLAERRLDRRVAQPAATGRDEKARGKVAGGEPSTLTAVVVERIEGAGVNEDLTGFAVFQVPHRQGSDPPVDVVDIEAHGLADPHAGGHQQANEGPKGSPLDCLSV